MKEINWQESPKTDLLAKDSSRKHNSKSHSPSSSFAARFAAGKSLNQDKKVVNKSQSTQAATYSERFLQASQNKRKQSEGVGGAGNGEIYQKKYSDIDSHQSSDNFQSRKKEPVYENKTNRKKDSIPSSEWKNLDLKNRKQTGDLYKKILYFNKKNDSKVFCFTSSRGKEGVSTVLVNLVDYIKNQATDKKVMIIDANFQSPSLYKIFNVPQSEYSLMDVFSHRIGIRNALTPIGANIFFLASGKSISQKFGNLEPDNFVSLLNECRQIVDYVLIDCPPVLISSDSLAVAPAADVSFLVIKAVKVQKAVAQKAISLLQDNECQIGGVILNYVQQVIPNWVYKFI